MYNALISTCFIIVCCLFLNGKSNLGDPSKITNFIKENPERTALIVTHNDSVMIALNQDQKFPLASTVKLIVAVTYAKQAAQGLIDPDARVPLSDLERYYLAGTDGGAHNAWLKRAEKNDRIKENHVSLRDVVMGMIWFSSNANTEYLMERLTLDSINVQLGHLGLPSHDTIYPIVSSLLLCQKPADIKDKIHIENLRAMPDRVWRTRCQQLHEQLKNDVSGEVKKSFSIYGLHIQRVWSDRLPAASARDYSRLIRLINRHDYFTSKEQVYLDEVIEWPMSANPKNKDIYTHLGSKGGSTAFILTICTYMQDLEGNRVEMVYFNRDLNPYENGMLQTNLNDFTIACFNRDTCLTLAAELTRK